MQIIQMADFHIDTNADLKHIKKKVDKLYVSLEESMSRDEQIILCLLGDIVDKGNANSYSIAKEVVTYLSDKFNNYKKFCIECVPGNHDLCGCPFSPNRPKDCSDNQCSLEDFNSFCIDIGASTCFNNSFILKEYEDVDLLIVNSVFNHNCKYGTIDFEAIQEVNCTKPTLLITHHTFLSENDSDHSAIRNAYAILGYIESKNIIGILHGHTHGYKDIVFGGRCRLIGVGPFLKHVPEINNQFNLISIEKTGISKIVNYFYQKDFNKYKSETLFSKKDIGIYIDSDLKNVYGHIVSDVNYFRTVPNLLLNVETTFESFNSQIEELFPDYIELAKDWQNETVPDNLYYNHGSYMRYKDINAIDFIINELEEKPTSSRAIVPLINFKDVVKSGDSYLPSFDIVQFGFKNELKDTLFVTLYLRALEVNHFLKINLCEIYVMCKRIQDTIRSIGNIDVTIHAFKAQYKEKFGCFAKAKLDTISEAKILRLLETGRIDEVNNLLTEKADFNETVIRDQGIIGLQNAFIALNEDRKVKENILNCVNNVRNTMESLKHERMKTSNYSEINKVEIKVNDAFKKLIEALNQGVFHDA